MTQNRFFTYDRRGFLSWETHPETAANSLGLGHHKDYTSYDSRGHSHRTVEGINDLSYTYDLAERPRLVYNTQFGPNCVPSPATTPTCVEQFLWDGATGLGKIQQETRYNHILFNGSPNTSAWTYTYTYQGPDGRLSQRDLQHTFNGSTTTGQESFTQSWTYTQLGKIDTETYPHCAPGFIYCTGTTTRAVQNLYSSSSGFLTGVNGYTGAAGITYYPNGMVSSVNHPSGLTATYGADPNGMPRPSSINAGGWTSGAYLYDGAGNVDQVGHGYYLYDPVSRLTTAQVETSELDNANPALDTFSLQTTSYDAFGNIQGFSSNSTPTDAATNHLTGATYDSSGNVRSWNGPPPGFQVPTYDYDELNQLKHYKNGAQEWFYMYGPGGERIWSFQPPANGLSRFDRWTLRGLDEKVRRTFELYGNMWTNNWGGSNLWEDHIYRGGNLLGAYLSGGQQHQIDVDHLGTPRLITTTAGGQFAYHVYLPYGVEPAGTSDFDRMKFTGHERDLADLSSTADDLDYMHARHTNPTTGRFLAVDPKSRRAALAEPQRWNRYSYVSNNPLKLVDFTGSEQISFQITIQIVANAVIAPYPAALPGVTAFAGGVKVSQHFTVETDPKKSANPIVESSKAVGETRRLDLSGNVVERATASADTVVLLSGRDSAGDARVMAGANISNPLIDFAAPIVFSMSISPNQSGTSFGADIFFGGYPTATVTATNESGDELVIYDHPENPSIFGPGDLVLGLIGFGESVSEQCSFGSGCVTSPH